MLRSYCLLIGEYFGTDSTNQIVEITVYCQRLARMVVSKKTLSLIRGIPIKCEARGQGPLHPSQLFNSVLSAANTAYFELPVCRNSNLYLIPSLSFRALILVAGSRMAKLFPHFNTRIAPPGLNRIS